MRKLNEGCYYFNSVALSSIINGMSWLISAAEPIGFELESNTTFT